MLIWFVRSVALKTALRHLVLLFPLVVCASSRAAPPTPDEIRHAVKQLGDEHYAVREKAMKLLWNAGPAAEAALLEAVNGNDPEAAKRARTLLDRFLYRIEPDTPKVIVDWMQQYRNGNPTEQANAIKEMLKLGSRAHPYLLRMLNAVNDERRRHLLEQFAFDDWKILVPLMVDGQENVVEQLLETAAASQIESIVPHYAAFYVLTDRSDEKIAQLRTVVETKGGAFPARLLAALYRSKGDWDGVLWATERSHQTEWVRWALLEKGQWNELLTRFTPVVEQNGLSQISGLGMLAAYQRLGVRPADFELTQKKILEYGAGPRRDAMPFYAAKALLINERPQQALELLLKHNQSQQGAELIMAQGRFADALALTETAAKAETAPQHFARVYHINLLHRLGKIKEAHAGLDALEKDMEQAKGPATWPERRIELEMRLGLVEQAEKHAVEALALTNGNYLGGVFAALFPELGARSETFWRLLRYQHPDEREEETLKRLRRLKKRQYGPEELGALLLRAAPNASWLPEPAHPSAFEHLASLVARAEREDVALALLKQPEWEKAPVSALVVLADTLAAANKWPDAADAYLKISQRDRSAPLPYFLHGWALMKLGKTDEARKIFEKTHRMLLGGDGARYYFHAALVERGFAVEARAEVQLRSRISSPGTWYHGQAMDHAARLAQETGDFTGAAALHERNILRLLPTSTGSGYSTFTGFLRATCAIHILRAKGLLAQGKIDDALREIERAEALHPMHLDLAIRLVPYLEKHGAKTRAAELYDRIYRRLEQNCRDYPDCADVHNQLAWLLVRCRRQLDEALTHSRQAVALAPQTAAYLDTLAEIHFQRGETAKAIELMHRCLKMPSTNAGFYHQQLKRFEKGDPKVEPALE